MKKLMILMISCLCLLSIVAAAQADVLFEDGEFSNWNYISLADPGKYAYMNRLATGGFPDAHLEVTTVTGTSGTAYCAMWNEDAVWDPSQDGAFSSISMSIDVKSISGWGEGQTLRILATQEGVDYWAPAGKFITNSSTYWHNVGLPEYHPEDFVPCYTQSGEGLDLSPEAPAIKFGFVVGNSRSGTYTQKYDNCSLRITDCIEVSQEIPDPNWQTLNRGTFAGLTWESLLGDWQDYDPYPDKAVLFSHDQVNIGENIEIKVVPDCGHDPSNRHIAVGGEIQTLSPSYRYGMYEVEMKAADDPHVVSAFFLYYEEREAGQLTDRSEIDIEILRHEDDGLFYVEFVAHALDVDLLPTIAFKSEVDLGFDPSEGFHKYTILWSSNLLKLYVDDAPTYTIEDKNAIISDSCRIMANGWNPSRWENTDRLPPARSSSVVIRNINYCAINLQSPQNQIVLPSPPTFTWTAHGGANNRYVVDLSIPGVKPLWTTPIIAETSWAMPASIWDRIPSGKRVYWRVRGADLDATPLKIITSDEVWSFRKQ